MGPWICCYSLPLLQAFSGFEVWYFAGDFRDTFTKCYTSDSIYVPLIIKRLPLSATCVFQVRKSGLVVLAMSWISYKHP